MIPLEHTGLLSNFWWAVVASDYSVSIFLAVSGIIAILKIIAILLPGNKSDSIVALIQGWLSGVPGGRRATDNEPTSGP